MRSSVIHAALVGTAMAAALVVGAACTGPDSPTDTITNFASTASGANLPHNAANLGDSLTSVYVTVVWNGQTLAAASYAYTMNITHVPASGTLKDVRITNGTGRDSTAGQRKGYVCGGGGGSAACPTVTGTSNGTVLGADTALYRTMRNAGNYVRVRSTVTTSPDSGGVALGSIYVNQAP